MNRRRFLRVSTGILGTTFAADLMAKESYARWDDESRAEYNNLLFGWLKTDFQGRAEVLGRFNKEPFEIKYGYTEIGMDTKKGRLFEKYAKGKLSGKDGEEHVRQCLADFSRVSDLLKEAERKAEPAWKYDGGNVFVKEGKIYELEVSASRLTVILDASPSMTPYLEKLRKEIGRDFPQTHFVEVDGCDLTERAFTPWFFAGYTPFVNPFKANRHLPGVPTFESEPHAEYIGWTRDCTGALECMVDLMESDAIYWFCDFDDRTDDTVIQSVAKKITDAKTKLYVHTLDKRPPALIAQLAEQSGGKVIRKRI